MMNSMRLFFFFFTLVLGFGCNTSSRRGKSLDQQQLALEETSQEETYISVCHAGSALLYPDQYPRLKEFLLAVTSWKEEDAELLGFIDRFFAYMEQHGGVDAFEELFEAFQDSVDQSSLSATELVKIFSRCLLGENPASPLSCFK